MTVCARNALVTNVSSPTHLRVEHLSSGEPIGVARPRFSWWLPAGAADQSAWELEVALGDGRTPWSSGRREGSERILVGLDAGANLPPARAGEQRTWRVRVWTEVGESDWSAPAPWKVGLLDSSELVSDWISPYEPVIASAGERPAYALRGTLDVEPNLAKATAFVTAHGIYELVVNGERVGDRELTPGFTSYRTRLQVQTFDLTGLLVPGANAIGIILSDGWFRGRHGFQREADGFGDRTGVLLDVELVGADGVASRAGTNATWRSSVGDILSADLMDGESVAPSLPTDWASAAFNASEWAPVEVGTGALYADRSRFVASVAPPVRRIREVAARTVSKLASGAIVVDFGENLNGWVRLTNLGPAGTRLVLTHGEVLGADRTVSTANLQAFDFVAGTPLPAGQVDRVVSAGANDVFEPRHTTHGFRYVQLDGHPGDLTTDQITAIVVHTDLVATGSFECSDDRINRLHAAGVRTFLANACEVPTDCPQRERSGFTGDWQVYLDTAAFTHDVAGFSDKWLRDLAADQWATGVVPNVVPDPHGNAPTGSFADLTNGSAGWGDAAVFVPWKLWRYYGDREILERQYPSMVAWVDYGATSAATKRHPDRVAAHPVEQSHERYLWDTGLHFGEWLEPDVEPSLDPTRDNNGVATAYLARSADLLSRVADILDKPDDAAKYRALSDGAKDAWRREQIVDGRLVVQTQAMHVRALAFELLTPELVQPVADRLAELVSAAGDHLSTGFLSTGLLLPALADHGHLDTAYRLLFASGIPSWLGMIDAGATTIWERWNGVAADGTATGSLNHYSKGAVLEFLHGYVAGIRATDESVGFQSFLIAPKPGGGITSARAHHDSLYGRVSSRWTLDGDAFSLEVEIPAGSTATIELPDGTRHERGTGTHRFDATLD